MRRFVLFLLVVSAAPAGSAPKPASAQAKGRKEMLAACQTCHPLNVIQLRRFDREDWDSVLRKMTALGARIRNREALLDYLSAQYGLKK